MPELLRHIPNVISIIRILLIVPIVLALTERHIGWAFWLFFIAGVSDALDGYLAKRFSWESRLGGILDALADKLLLVSTLICLWWLDIFPLWFVVVVFSRDIIIVLGSTYYNFRVESLQPAPSRISKLNTFLQIVLVALAVVNMSEFDVPESLLDGLMWAVVATVFMSGADYIWQWGARAFNKGRH